MEERKKEREIIFFFTKKEINNRDNKKYVVICGICIYSSLDNIIIEVPSFCYSSYILLFFVSFPYISCVPVAIVAISLVFASNYYYRVFSPLLQPFVRSFVRFSSLLTLFTALPPTLSLVLAFVGSLCRVFYIFSFRRFFVPHLNYDNYSIWLRVISKTTTTL